MNPRYRQYHENSLSAAGWITSVHTSAVKFNRDKRQHSGKVENIASPLCLHHHHHHQVIYKEKTIQDCRHSKGRQKSSSNWLSKPNNTFMNNYRNWGSMEANNNSKCSASTETENKSSCSSGWDGRPFGHNRHGPKIGGCAPLWMGSWVPI